MAGILGKKIGMTQVFEEEGRVIPVTVIQSGACSVLQLRTKEKHGYTAICLGFEDINEDKINKPQAAEFKRIKVRPKKFIKEILVEDPQNYKVAQDMNIEQFAPGDLVNIIGVSKGKGFQGGIKRWNWSGGPATHGSMSHRAPGSIGASSFPSRVFKGQHLPGHMGNQQVTVQNLEVIKVDKDNNLIVIKGSVPGPKNCFLIIKKSKKKKKLVQRPKQAVKKEEAKKEPQKKQEKK